MILKILHIPRLSLISLLYTYNKVSYSHTTKELGKGTGFGLSISHRIIVDTHKGDIRFNSKPGETIFQVRLPVIYKGTVSRG
jgi:signal transduction histidine kinase